MLHFKAAPDFPKPQRIGAMTDEYCPLIKVNQWTMDEHGPFMDDLPVKHDDFPWPC
jgi:hypothetical protein